MSDTQSRLDDETHARLLREEIIPKSGMNETSSQDHPKAVVLAGQPGAGKSKVAGALLREFNGDVVPVDPDELRTFHPEFVRLRKI